MLECTQKAVKEYLENNLEEAVFIAEDLHEIEGKFDWATENDSSAKKQQYAKIELDLIVESLNEYIDDEGYGCCIVISDDLIDVIDNSIN